MYRQSEVADPDRAYAEYRDRPPSGVPTPRGAPLSTHCSRSTTLVTEMLNGAVGDLCPIEPRTRTVARLVGSTCAAHPDSHVRAGVYYPG